MISLTLPPGSGFSPSEEQLCCYYLARKNNAPIDDGGFEGYRGYEAIKELNLYEYHPSALPEYTCFNYGYGARGRHWYFYTKVSDAEVSERRAVGGFWELQTFDLVNPSLDVTVGNIKVFHFYEGNSRTTGCKTNWVLYEYSLQEKGLFYVCRVFSDSRREKAEAFFKVRKDEVSSSSTASDDRGGQHRGFLTTNTPEATRNPDLFADSTTQITGTEKKNDVADATTRLRFRTLREAALLILLGWKESPD
ncbi:hypothetical protein K2173_026147 [Erythroxylum novogranatense]|uniref:NAC domain-containing protein n=1 Tax=Erythroxylum novogranatense TaxID=1862640 RepID=A0AAV8TA97_9ROSI|nr:hypothetical protein K2173_026147 [Erythroxylum novogranatense]